MPMTACTPGQPWPLMSGRRLIKGAAASVLFGSRERELALGFVTARIRLFNLLHGNWATEISVLAEVLSELLAGQLERGRAPGVLRPALPPQRVIVRLGEPVTGTGLVVFPICWQAGDGGSLPVLDAGLALRAGRPGWTFLRLNGRFRLPLPAAATRSPDIRPARPPVTAAADAWLARVADSITGAAAR